MIKQKKYLLVTLSFIIVLGCTLVACGKTKQSNTKITDTSFADVKKAGVLKMGLDDSFPPMGFRNEKNEIVGFDIDLANATCEKLGIKLKLIPIDWSMKETELDAHNVDVLWNGYSFNPERNKKNLLSKPYLQNKQVFVVMKDSPIHSIDDLKQKNLALQEQSTAEDAINEHPEIRDQLANIITFNDNVTAFKDLEARTSDALLTDSVLANYYIHNQADPSQYVILDQPLSTENYVIAFRKQDIGLKNAVQNALDQLKKEGTISNISKKWFN